MRLSAEKGPTAPLMLAVCAVRAVATRTITSNRAAWPSPARPDKNPITAGAEYDMAIRSRREWMSRNDAVVREDEGSSFITWPIGRLTQEFSRSTQVEQSQRAHVSHSRLGLRLTRLGRKEPWALRCEIVLPHTIDDGMTVRPEVPERKSRLVNSVDQGFDQEPNADRDRESCPGAVAAKYSNEVPVPVEVAPGRLW